MSKNLAAQTDVITLKPSDIAAAIRAVMQTDRAMFIWGPPGIAKSAVAQQVATSLNMAFIDLRLSQLDPTDLRGIPYPTTIFGVTGVQWSPPFALPADLDLTHTVAIEDPDVVRVRIPNPKGSNGIHYVQRPKFTVKSLTKGATAIIVEEAPDELQIALVLNDDNGHPTDEFTTGRVRVNVTGEAKAILGLEEFNSAAPAVQAIAYQLTLDRRIGEYVVPDSVFILGMGNRETDKGVTYRMPTPILNRFVHVEAREDFDDWCEWALNAGIDATIIGYLSAFKDHLFEFKPEFITRGFPTPRSWHAASDILLANPDLPDKLLLGLIAGTVGDGKALTYLEHRRFAADLPRVEDILSGRLKEMQKQADVALSYTLVTSIWYQMKEEAKSIEEKYRVNREAYEASPERANWLARADNALLFIMNPTNFQPEIAVMAARSAVNYHNLPFSTQRMKHFKTFCDRYKQWILGTKKKVV